ncbi:hypothetical protein BDZ45DRAFT_799902 [Acephala macrosclerotiorum]|nr:hypothetical protein BDZ45DRAFT_799902 [Acephala macrosclerotiorum]
MSTTLIDLKTSGANVPLITLTLSPSCLFDIYATPPIFITGAIGCAQLGPPPNSKCQPSGHREIGPCLPPTHAVDGFDLPGTSLMFTWVNGTSTATYTISNSRARRLNTYGVSIGWKEADFATTTSASSPWAYLRALHHP